MSRSNRNASASSSHAQQQTGSSGRNPRSIPVPRGTTDGPYLSGESSYEGKLVADSYTTDECRLKDECVQFQLDDGRIVGAESEGARSLREATGGKWNPYTVFRVTMYGESSFIKRVEMKFAIKDSELEESLAEV